ncbi:hypothetical protein FT669_01790 [Aeromonas jandaei]|nr:hypothetical protein FT669_01790 [Aeromonas jandaei]
MLKMESEMTRALDDIEFISSKITESSQDELGRLESIIKTLCRSTRSKIMAPHQPHKPRQQNERI